QRFHRLRASPRSRGRHHGGRGRRDRACRLHHGGHPHPGHGEGGGLPGRTPHAPDRPQLPRHHLPRREVQGRHHARPHPQERVGGGGEPQRDLDLRGSQPAHHPRHRPNHLHRHRGRPHHRH